MAANKGFCTSNSAEYETFLQLNFINVASFEAMFDFVNI